MDLNKTIAELLAQRDKIDAAIKQLESLKAVGAGPFKPRSPRARKFIGADERRDISTRMKRYWEKRRQPSLTSGRES